MRKEHKYPSFSEVAQSFKDSYGYTRKEINARKRRELERLREVNKATKAKECEDSPHKLKSGLVGSNLPLSL